ncbi:TolC family protein, partial [Janthinobacterium sp.]|uniref:TolC family protein n=1 Tax=Janthinobacterium sp. TaxID=1871054 RepID=UPI00293D324A
MHRLLLLPLCVAVCALPAGAAAPAPLSPQEIPSGAAPAELNLAAAIALAMRANPTLAAARHEVAAVDGAARQAGARPNPELQTLVEDTRRASRSTTIQFNQRLEVGGQRAARLAVAQHARDGAAIGLLAQTADTRAAVIQAYFEALAAREGVRLADAANTLARRAAEIAARRVAAGKASPVESSRARVAEAGARLDAG